MSFEETGLSEDVLRAVTDTGYTTPTPIQAAAIPLVLMGRDILACAQTGTGKTASFTLPMIDVLHHGRAKMRMPRSLILEPTRELATQVAENFDTYGKYHKLSKVLLIGGTDMKKQAKLLDAGADVLIATPGRLLDMFERGHLLMRDVKILVIDEADRMLDMGFIPDIEKIVTMLPPLRQTLFFSATMAPAIKKIADKFLMNPKIISVAPPASTSEMVTQGLVTLKPGGQYHGMDGKKKLKRDVLRKLIGHKDVRDAIVFCNRKIDVATVYKSLSKHGLSVGQLHGDMSQPARTETLAAFKNKEFAILVCSDVAARGLDVPNLSHVFNYDVPNHAEDYVHRIGRTGRAGKEGHAYTLALPEDGKYIAAIEKLIGLSIPVLDVAGFEAGELSNEAPARGGRDGTTDRNKRGGRGGRGRGGPKPDAKVETKVALKDEAAAVIATPDVKIETSVKATPERQPRPAKKQHSRNTRNDFDDRSRDIHNQVCEGHMPAFLINPPPSLPKAEAPVKAPAKPRARRKPAAKKVAAEAVADVPTTSVEAVVDTSKTEA